MQTLDLNPNKYQLIKSLRPFSYSVAIITCGLGIMLAYQQGVFDWWRAGLIVLAGVLLQAASNLANDFADIRLWKLANTDEALHVIKKIRRLFLLGSLFTLIGSLIGLWLVATTDWQLLALGIFGVIGGYSYTGDPINYKQRGWGVYAVFWFTGILMINGAFYSMTAHWSTTALIAAIPVSLLSSALLLANEIRDYQEDISNQIATFTVRRGEVVSKWIYRAILVTVFPISLLLWWQGILTYAWFMLSLPLIYTPLKLSCLLVGTEALRTLPPLTGRFYMVFGLLFITSV